MKITCQRESLLNSFQTAATIAPSRSPKPILQNIKIEATKEQSILMATDMELGIRITVDGVEVEVEGSAIFPVTRFGALLRESSDETLMIQSDGNQLKVQGERSEFQMPCHNPAEFPNVEKFEEERYFEAPATLVKELIRRTLFATDPESSRFALGGILLEFSEDRIVAVGTDGRRLAKMEGPVNCVGGFESHETMTIVPSRSMQLIDRALAANPELPVQISPRPNDILIHTENATIYSRLVDGRFPKWRDVIPEGRDDATVELVVGPTFSALRQASIVTSDESRGIDFKFTKGQMTLTAKTAEIGNSRVDLPVEYDGDQIVVALDHRFVADFLKVLNNDKSFAFHIADSDSAALCSTDDGYHYVLMPLARDRATQTAS